MYYYSNQHPKTYFSKFTQNLVKNTKNQNTKSKKSLIINQKTTKRNTLLNGKTAPKKKIYGN